MNIIQLTTLDEIAPRIQADLYDPKGRGYMVIDGIFPAFDPSCGDPIIPRLTSVSNSFGIPLKAVDRLPLWQPVGVNLKTEPFRAGGIGYNPMHIDLLNAERPPDLTALFCVREDPLGGGENLVSNLQTAVEQLSPTDIEILMQKIFREGQFYGLSGVGKELDPFPVLTRLATLWQVRFSGKMIPSLHDGAEKRTLEKFESLLIQNQERVPLKAGQLLVMNQFLIAHARQALGQGQPLLAADQRRLILQLFLRFKFPFVR